MKELISFIVAKLVDHPDAVEVIERDEGDTIIIELSRGLGVPCHATAPSFAWFLMNCSSSETEKNAFLSTL